MKIQILKKQLLDGILIVEKITGKKESLPVLSCILLDIQGDLRIRATNLEAGVEVVVSCEVSEKGIVAVSPTILSQTLRSISGEKVSLHLEDGNLCIESKGTRTLIKAVPPDEFPALSKGGDGSQGVEVVREKFIKGVQSVLYAASISMIRPELGSVYISVKQSGLLFVATDSFRLAEKSITGASGGDLGDILIPLKHINELVYILERVLSEKIEVKVEDSQLVVVGDGVRYISRVIDANFPDYKTIIPKSSTTEATLLKGDFADMLRKARVFSGTEQHIGFHIYPKKKIFSATAQSAEVGEMSDTLDAAISGDDLDINFHIGYISDCLNSIPSDSVTLSFAGIGRPLVIRGAGEASFTYLVMPLNR
jgi:DNA polymerase III subunit beta